MSSPRTVATSVLATTLATVTTVVVVTAPGATPDTESARPVAPLSAARTPAATDTGDSSTITDTRVSRDTRAAIEGVPGAIAPSAAQTDPAGVEGEVMVSWASPVAAPFVSSCFGSRGGEQHRGADLPKPLGTPIRAIGAGVVVAAGPASGFGYRVVIEHPDGVTSTYGHMRYWDVAVGQAVAAGQQIAVVGNEGQSTGPHVHLEVRVQNEVVDPSLWLRGRGVDLGTE